MATNTYVALNTTTVATATPSITFTGINQGYTDLVLVISAATTHSSSTFLRVEFNSDTTGTNYSYADLTGNGTANDVTTRGNNAWLGANYNSISTVIGDSTSVTRFKGYSNSTTFKSYISRTGRGSTSLDYFGTGLTAGTWRNTNAITSLTIYNSRGGTNYNFAVGSTFSLYGIRAEGVSPAAKATGGAIYSDDTYYYHAFASSGTFTPTQALTADVLVVAGGGGGGWDDGGAGGAGGLALQSSRSFSATSYTCTVGAGGPGGSPNLIGYNGNNSTLDTITATGGGGGGTGNASGGRNGANGGSGGGGSYTNGSGGNGAGGTGITGTSGGATLYGNSGGSGLNASPYPTGGGGGAGGAGGNGSGSSGGAGGIGRTDTLIQAIGLATGFGQNVSGTYYIAGGGGGSAAGSGTAGAGGYGGGSNGGNVVASQNALANTGGGGGADGSTGGSGVIVIRYAKV